MRAGITDNKAVSKFGVIKGTGLNHFQQYTGI